jgi:membrane protein implicated in regulation of membrane protease activity
MLMAMPSLAPMMSATRQVATRSVLNPILFLVALVVPVGMVCSVFAPPPLNYAMFALIAGTVAAGVWAYCYFAVKAPQRLHSEQHTETMEAIARMGAGGKEIILPHTQFITENPTVSAEASDV